jgi:hypothetical protein
MAATSGILLMADELTVVTNALDGLKTHFDDRLDRLETKVDTTNGKVRALEIFRAVLITIGTIGAFAIANAAAWLALT